MNRRDYMLAGGPQDQEQIWLKMSALGFDHEDVLLMVAPKPVRVLAVTWDFFPIDATRRTVQRCKRIWEMCGNPSGLDMVEDVSTHAYTRTLAKYAAEFFSECLLEKKVTVDDADIEPLELSRTYCTKSGQVRGEIDGARFVYDENQDRLAQLEHERAAIPEKQRRERAVAWLKERVFANRAPVDMNPRFFTGTMLEELNVRSACWWSQRNLLNYGLMFRHFRYGEEELPLSAAVWDGGCSNLRPHRDWIFETCEGGRAVLVLNPAGVGHLAPHPISSMPLLEFYGTIYKLSDDLFWLDDSMAAMRVYDVIRALDMIERWPGVKTEDIRFYASGLHSIYPRLARMLDARIAQVELAGDAFTGWADWIKARYYEERDILSVIIPGALRYFDVPDADRWGAGSR